MNSKALEQSVRRRLNAAGYKLVKSRASVLTYDDQGGYMIVDLSHNSVVKGGRFELSLDDVEIWLAED